jgi:hypothetical protein
MFPPIAERIRFYRKRKAKPNVYKSSAFRICTRSNIKFLSVDQAVITCRPASAQTKEKSWDLWLVMNVPGPSRVPIMWQWSTWMRLLTFGPFTSSPLLYTIDLACRSCLLCGGTFSVAVLATKSCVAALANRPKGILSTCRYVCSQLNVLN